MLTLLRADHFLGPHVAQNLAYMGHSSSAGPSKPPGLPGMGLAHSGYSFQHWTWDTLGARP